MALQGFDTDNSYSTKRGIREYSKMHEIDFCKLLQEKSFQGMRVLDVGCGNGVFVREIKEKFPHLDVHGIDRREYLGWNSQCVVGDVRKMPFADNHFDLVVSSAVEQWIYHQRENFYQEIERVLNKEGYGFVFPCNLEILQLSSLNKQDFKTRVLNKGNLEVNHLLVGRALSLSRF